MLSRIIWQTNDPKLEHRKSISSWIEYEDLTKKMPQTLEIDVEKIPLRLAHYLQEIVSINLIDVAQWFFTVALLESHENYSIRDNFGFFMGHLKFVTST